MIKGDWFLRLNVVRIVTILGIIAILGIAGCNGDNGSTAPTSIPNPVGMWSVTPTWSSSFLLEFMEGGTLHYIPLTPGFVDAYGNWTQNGNAISFDISSYSYWEGTISNDGNTMSGSMYNLAGMTGTWTAVKQ